MATRLASGSRAAASAPSAITPTDYLHANTGVLIGPSLTAPNTTITKAPPAQTDTAATTAEAASLGLLRRRVADEITRWEVGLPQLSALPPTSCADDRTDHRRLMRAIEGPHIKHESAL
jgi:hypothetical protein